MKMLLLNTVEGLKPMSDNDYDQKKKLKLGEIYQVDVKKYRNYQFHKKYWALINCSWEYLNEKQTAFFKESKDLFRKTVQMAAGYSEPIYSINRKEWIEEAKSISFEKMDELEFQELYGRVKDVLFMYFLSNISEEEFNKNMINF